MILILDANVIFSALLKGKPLSMSVELKNKGIELITPDFLVEEFFKKRKELSKILCISEEQILVAFTKMMSELVRVVHKEEYVTFLDEAKKISPDKKDVPYFALSLALDKAPIWSREPRLRRQKVVKVLDDKGVERLMKELD
jgi:predicted nucleic acid-binding protein